MEDIFSSNSQNIIEKKLEINSNSVLEDKEKLNQNLEYYFEIKKIAEWINENKFKRVKFQID